MIHRIKTTFVFFRFDLLCEGCFELISDQLETRLMLE
jgi:hypothetical protein